MGRSDRHQKRIAVMVSQSGELGDSVSIEEILSDEEP
jgi:hypothetical protein